MRAKIARRYQITIPEEVREDVGMNVGDTVDVRSQEGKVIIEKIGRNWKTTMNETRGSWKNHPRFAGMKDATEIVDWLRQTNKKK